MKFGKRLMTKAKGSLTTRPVLVVLAFGLSGVVALAAIRAAVPTVSLESEQGSRTAQVAAVTDTSASGGSAVRFSSSASVPSQTAGLFITRDELDRAKVRSVSSTSPFRSSYNTLKSRADGALTSTPDPFYMTQTNYLNNLRFAWSWSSCPDTNSADNNSLSDAVSKLEEQGDDARTLALQYAITGDVRYGNKARDYLLAWANGSTPVNMYDFFVNPTTLDGGLRGSDGTTCNRPWNMALDGLFQGYGLINFSDAYVLLNRNGYALSSTENTAITTYLRQLSAAVNSSYHAWAKWADTHNCTPGNNSDTCVRYRSDNHLSWGLAPILASAVALNDQTIADYVLTGGSWDDGRSGLYKNPSPIREVINRAVLSNGRIYDEASEAEGGIGREGYAFYHLWALGISARIAEVHYPAVDVWGYKGADGKGLQEAYTVEADRVLSGQNGGDNWQYEFVYNKWPTTQNLNIRNSGSRTTFVAQSYGPVVLLVGQ